MADAHQAEYVAAVAGMTDIYGQRLPERNEAVRGVSAGKRWSGKPHPKKSFLTALTDNGRSSITGREENDTYQGTLTMRTTIKASASTASIHEPSAGYGAAGYTVTLTVGEREIEIPCWGHCGWLAPGASADLDGSGLSLWGDSQPGGWSVCDGDGADDGRPRVIAGRSPSCDTAITVGAALLGSTAITPDMVPEWSAALADLSATPEGAEEWDDRESDAADVRAAVEEAVEAALDDISCDCDEPTGDDVWEALGRAAEVEGAECVRVGRWIGCPLVAWREGGRVSFDWRPTIAPPEAVEAASRAAADTAAAAVEDAVASVLAGIED